MSIASITGQNNAKQLLQNGLRERKFSHAYLFSGPPGTGKKQLALAFAQSILCLQESDDACGQCVECRKVLHGNHPDIITLAPEGNTIKIEQIRQLQRTFTYRGETDQKRVYIMEQADRTTVQAANSLLKFLEEPQLNIIAVLLTDNEQMLLPTILSRVLRVPFSTADWKEMTHILLNEGYNPELVHIAVHLRAGLEGVRQLLQFQEFAEIRNVVIQLGKEAMKGPAASIFIQQYVAKSSWQDHLDLFLDILSLWFRDMIQAQIGRRDKLVFQAEQDELKKMAYSKPLSAWIHDVEATMEARKMLRFHANPQLTLEQLLFRIQEG